MSWRQSTGRGDLTAWQPSTKPKSPTLWPMTSIGMFWRALKPSNASRPKRFAAVLASAFCICGASPTSSSAATGPPPSNIAEITTLAQGEPAPFAGDLFPVEDSIRWALEIEGCAERAAAELDHAKALYQIELSRQRALAAADGKADRLRAEILAAELAQARAWYRSPAFVATVAATVAIATLLASTILVQATAEVRP